MRRSISSLVLLAVAPCCAVPACAVDVRLEGRRCDGEHACAPGWLCVEGECVAEGDLARCQRDDECEEGEVCALSFCVPPTSLLDGGPSPHDAGAREDAGLLDGGRVDGGETDAGSCAPGWWDDAWSLRLPLIVGPAPSSATIEHTFDAPLSAAIHAASLLSGDDLRVVWRSPTGAVEIDRAVLVLTPTAVVVGFRLQGAALPDASGEYDVYVGNPSAGAPPADPGGIYAWHDDFDEGGGALPSTLVATGGAVTLEPDGSGYSLRVVSAGRGVVELVGASGSDVRVEATVNISSADVERIAGYSLRAADASVDGLTSWGAQLVEKDDETNVVSFSAGIYSGELQSASTIVEPSTDYRFGAVARASILGIYVDGVLQQSYDIGPPAAGYDRVALQVFAADVTFDDVTVTVLPPDGSSAALAPEPRCP